MASQIVWQSTQVPVPHTTHHEARNAGTGCGTGGGRTPRRKPHGAVRSPTDVCSLYRVTVTQRFVLSWNGDVLHGPGTVSTCGAMSGRRARLPLASVRCAMQRTAETGTILASHSRAGRLASRLHFRAYASRAGGRRPQSRRAFAAAAAAWPSSTWPSRTRTCVYKGGACKIMRQHGPRGRAPARRPAQGRP